MKRHSMRHIAVALPTIAARGSGRRPWPPGRRPTSSSGTSRRCTTAPRAASSIPAPTARRARIREIDWIKVLVDAGYTPEEGEVAAQSREPDAQPGPRPEPDGVPRQGSRERLCRIRLRRPRPVWSASRGTIGEGVESRRRCEDRLHSPTGEKGIDNDFYRTLGCWKTYRGPPRLSSGALQFNDSMRNGAWTTVIVVAGQATTR